MAQSQNGYTANKIDHTKTWTIPGTDRQVRLREGDAGWLLVHFAAWFHKNIEPIDAGQLDDWGYAERPIRGSSTTLSNHASGTAIDLNAVRHPLGVRGTFTRGQAEKIRVQLKEYGGVIRWGGDYKNRADEMHFEIVGSPAAVSRVADRLQKHRSTTPVQPKKARAIAGIPLPTRPRYITLRETQFRSGPGKDYPVVRTVPAGSVFTGAWATKHYRRHAKPVEWAPAADLTLYRPRKK